MNASKAIKAAIAVVVIVALVASGKGAYRPELTNRPNPTTVAVVL